MPSTKDTREQQSQPQQLEMATQTLTPIATEQPVSCLSVDRYIAAFRFYPEQPPKRLTFSCTESAKPDDA